MLHHQDATPAHAHHHHDPDLTPAARTRARRVLAAIVIPLLALTIAGIALIAPGAYTHLGELQATSAFSERTAGVLASEVKTAQAVTVGKDPAACPLVGLETAPALGASVCARITSGIGQGQVVPVHVPVEYVDSLSVGTRLRLLYDPAALSGGSPYIFWDAQRSIPLAALAACYLIVVIAVAGWRGVRALAGLAASIFVLIAYIAPALIAGANPLAVTLSGVGAMMFLSVYVAHGISIRTTTAILGTAAGLAVTVILAATWVGWATLSGATSEDAQILSTAFTHLSLSALLTCGIVIAGLGALNDVTITQAATVWELSALDPDRGPLQIFASAMRIGRDHIASTVYTLAFAYAGTALPTVLIASLARPGWGDILTSAPIAEELVRTLVASIGLILAIPLTTLIGAFLVKFGSPAQGRATE